MSGIPKARRLYQLLAGPTVVNRLGKRVPPKAARSMMRAGTIDRGIVRVSMPRRLRQELQDEYREDIERLQDLIGQDLAAWMS